MDRLRRLYSEHQNRLYKYFYIRTSNEQVAEDLTQDVFYEASKSIHLYRGEASLTSWMYAIANNLLKKHYRSKKYEQSLHTKLQQPLQAVRSAEDIVTEKLYVQAMHEQIMQLDEVSKQIVLLRLYSELSFKEIGEIISCSENYARVQFHRLKRQLQKGGDER
ncbi:MAG: sigma-70 family RNA polymerase sigma factor [Lysinibacillus sp.]